MTANIWTTGGGEWDSSQILCEEAELNADGAQQGEGRCLTEERHNNAWANVGGMPTVIRTLV